MAIKSTFIADFTSFSSAVQGAQVTLKGFEGDANKVGSALNRMTDQFTGRKVQAEATLMAEAFKRLSETGVKFTADELQKMGTVADAAIAKFHVMGQEVPKDIQAMSDASKEASATWSGFVENFDPKAAIANPMGTAVAAVEALATSMGPLVVAASAVGSVLGAVGVGLFHLTEAAAKVGGTLNDMSQKTGISVPMLSRLSQAAQVAGTDIGALSDVIYKMDIQAADSPEKFAKGMERLGLNTKEFLALSPDQRLLEFSKALNETADASDRNAAGAEVMGKQFKDLGPSIMKLNEALTETAGISVWSEQQAADAEKFEMQVKALKLAVADLGISIGRDLLPAALSFLAFLKEAGPALADVVKVLFPFITAGREIGSAWDTATAAVSVFRQEFGKLPPVVGDVGHVLTDVEKKAKSYWQSMTAPAAVIGKSFDELNAMWRDQTKSMEGVTKATKEHAAEVIGLGEGEKTLEGVLKLQQQALQDYYKRLEQIIPATRDWNSLLAITPGEIIESSNALTNWDHIGAKVATETLPGLVEGTGIAASGFQQFGDAVVNSLKDLPAQLQAAFTGGGGIGGAIKAIGVTLGQQLGKSISAGMQTAVSIGTAGATALGGAVGGSTGATVAALAGPIGAASLQMAGLVTTTVALGAATLGIGAAAVGVYLLAKHWLKVSDAEKEARKTFEDYAKALGANNVTQFIAVVGEAYKKMGKDGVEAQQDIQRALDATHVSAQAEAAALKIINDKLAEGEKQAKEFADATAHIDDAAAGFNAVATALGDNKESLEGLGRQAVTTFALMLAAGKPFAAALKAIGPGLDTLRESYKKLGLTVGNTGLGILLMQQQIGKANPDLIAGVDGLAASLSALGNLGLVNEQSFKDMEKAGAEMYTRLQGETAALGGTTKDALLPMQEFLHNAAEQAEKLGIPLDDNTQMLINQSKELGIWKEKGVDPMLQGMKDMVKAVQDLVKALTGTGGATDAIKKVGKTADESIPDNPYKNWKMPEVKIPDMPGAPGQSTGPGGAGGGSSNLVAFPGGRSVPLVTPTQQRAVLSGAASGGPIEITLVTQLDGRVVAETVTRVQDNDQRLRRKMRAA